MKNHFKRNILVLMVCSLLIAPNYARGATQNESLFDRFSAHWEEGTTIGENFTVVNQDSEDVTTTIYSIYNLEGIKAAYDYYENNGCRISYDIIEVSLTRSNQTVSVSHLQEYTGYDEHYPSMIKRWTTKLTGRYVYNVGTDEIISASAPVLSLYESNFGAAFTPRFDEVSTNYSINKSTNKVYFSASYRMRAVFGGISVLDIPLGFDMDYGTRTTSFYAGP